MIKFRALASDWEVVGFIPEEGLALKKILLTSVVALFLATGTAHGEEEYTGEYIWYYDCRHGSVTKDFTRTAKDEYDNPPVEVSETHATIERKEFDKMLKVFPRLLRQMKACDAYYKCLDDRDAGKVKHCYTNDRRWREFITGAW